MQKSCQAATPSSTLLREVNGKIRFQLSLSRFLPLHNTICLYRHTVNKNRCAKPARATCVWCVVGAFQSEALRVPEHCQFDHIHDSTECKTYDAWNLTTSEACRARHGAALHRFSVLQPCAIDGFNGAEFVCCPTPGQTLHATLLTI